jgi:DNA-binding helix-hairpin-helix protein with protein kinase domain
MNRTTRLLPVLRDGRGQVVTLGEQLASGGEGAVYRVHGQPNVVAKLYHEAVSQAKAAKLRALTRQPPPAKVAAIAAWPTSLLLDERSRIMGFLMPLVSGRTGLTSLLATSLRRSSFPMADWRFLIAVARNVAAAVETLHAHGFVIGDLNDGGFLVSPTDATVIVVDIDSLQVRDGATVLRCEVAKPLYTPPELHGATFTAVDRTEHHDSFSLGVLIFQLIFLGRHPFAGRPLGDEELNPEQWIREHRFAYGRAAARKRVAPPPNIIQLQDLTSGLGELFEQAFSETAPRSGRPPATAWRQALDQMQQSLRACGTNRAHFYATSRVSCPWCEIEQATGASLFPALVVNAQGELTINVDQLIADITAFDAEVRLALPPRPTSFPTPTPLPPAVRTAHRWYHARVVIIGILSAVLGVTIHVAGGSPWFIAFIVLGNFLHGINRGHLAGEQTKRRAGLAQVESALQEIERSRDRLLTGDAHHRKRQALDDIASFRSVADRQAKDLSVVHAKDQERQLDEYLSQFTVARASIPGIGDGRRATLIAYGIQTAADVDRNRIRNIPRFGDALTATMMAWRQGLQRGFTLQPKKYSAAITAEITARYQAERQALAAKLQQHWTHLRGARERDQVAMLDLERRLRTAQAAWAQATADAHAVA